MRRSRTLLLFYLLCSFAAHAQNIDSLTSDQQLLAFLKKIHKDGDTFHTGLSKRTRVPPYLVERSRQFSATAFEKADLDQNGHTDLLFDGYASLGNIEYNVSMVVLAFGNDSFQVKDLLNTRSDIFVTRLITTGGQTGIKTLSLRYKYNQETGKDYIETLDTLMYACGNFIEMAIPGNYHVEQLNYCCWGGLGVAGISIKIYNDSAILQADNSLSSLAHRPVDSGGTFVARLDKATQSRVLALLNHINFPSLKNHYAVESTCHSTGYLHIIYDNGIVKQVSDYGLSGTYGLAALHSLLWEMKATQRWTLIKPYDPMTLTCPD